MRGRRGRESLATGLERHVAEEETILGEYRSVAGALRNGPAGLLIRFIFRDEEQHHFLLREMAQRLKGPLEEEIQIEGTSRAELVKMIKRLVRHEEKTIRECRKLKSKFSAGERALFGALLDGLVYDSEKHRRLLLALNRIVKV